MLKTTREALIALSLICCGGADAQDQPEPDAVAAATELIVALRINDGLIESLPAILLAMKPLVTRAQPESERDFDFAAPQVLNEAKARVHELLGPIASVYARNFTVSEMREMGAFYRKPTGQKFLDKSSVLEKETAIISQTTGNAIAREMHQRMIEELRKLGQKP